MRQIRQSNIVPARIARAASVAWLELIDGAGEVCPAEMLHVYGRVVGTLRVGDAAVLQLGLGGALVDVGLGDEDGEGDVGNADVGPGDVLSESLAALP